MKKYISILLTLSIILLMQINVFAEDELSFINDNENVSEYSLENTNGNIVDEHTCESCRIPNLSIEDQEQLLLSNPSNPRYNHVNSTFLDTYAAHYFLQLKDNIPNNFKGSCSYVAATMLLSYYDTYWDDNIVEDRYIEKTDFNSNLLSLKSPGPKSISDADEILYTEAEYYEILENFCNTDLQCNLIKMAVEEHIDGIFEYFSLFPHEVKLLLEHYLYEEIGFSSSEVSVELIIPGTTNLREYTIEKVTQGIPVFVSAAASLDSAHSFIIYDYDENADELYCHMGWKNTKNSDGEYDTTHVALSTVEYQFVEGLVSISFNSEHSHSDNYVDSEGDTYCSCEFACHPEHKHRYRVLEDYEDTHHAYECLCSLDNEPEEHTFIYSKIDDNTHSVSCAFCDYEDIQTHSLIRTNTQDDANHDVYCELCEYTDSLPHNYKCYGTIGPTMHTELCTECGYYHGGVAYPQIISTNETSHALGCDDCGFAVEVVNHNFDYTIVSNSVHEKHCTVCDYTATSSHNYTYDYEQLNASAHYAYCECGARSSFGHNFYQSGDYNICSDCSYKEQTTHTHSYTYLPRAGGRFHLKQCECGDSKLEACLGVSDGNGTSICIACGQTVISGPGIILSDDEEDEELK